MSDVRDWSVSAGGNTSVSPDGFPEGMAPSGVNDAAREVMAAVARTARVRYPFYTATASLSTNVSYSVDRPDISLGAYYQGWTTSFIAPVANTGTASLQWTGLTAYPLKYQGSHLQSSAINANDVIVAAYNARGPSFDILSPLDAAAIGSTITLSTEVATTSGTAINFTGIPATAKRITIMLVGVSTNGTSPLQIQIGDSGGIESSTYVGSASQTSTSVATTAYSAGFLLSATNVAANLFSGTVILALENASNNTWTCFGVLGFSNIAATAYTGGYHTLSGGVPLDRIRLTTVNGSDTFDAGAMNISYE